MRVLGIDPDTHNMGIVVADETTIYLAYSLDIPADLKGRDAVVEMCKAVWCAMGPLIQRAIQPTNQPIDRIVVEGQRIYEEGMTANPMSLLYLGQVAGAALTAAMCFSCQPNAVMPYPSEWKGTMPKEVSQGRAYRHYGLPFEVVKGSRHNYAVPVLGPEAPCPPDWPSKGKWKHVGDALALALWGLQTHTAAVARAARVSDPELNAALGRRGIDPTQPKPKRRRR